MQITDPQDILNYLSGGNAEFTLKSLSSGEHRTFRLSSIPGDKGGYFASHLTGSDNEHDFSYICIVPQDLSRTIRTKASPANTLSIAALDWFLRCLNTRCAKLAQVEFYHSGKCSACGRKLTTPESIEHGMGPVCRERLGR